VSIESLSQAITQALEALSLDERIAAINTLREAIHKVSPFAGEPVDFVRWVKSDAVYANDYNPNSVAPPEMELLRLSIEADGYTQPIVAMRDQGAEINEVIDGFHRHRVGKECADIQARVHGYLPVVNINADRRDKSDRMASTIRHNRARGEHRVDQMAEIVIELKRRFWSDEKISKELGMDADEVLRLTQVTGLAGLFADRDFSEAWEAETLHEVEGADELDA
jgi:ParB-like chromosome segregation protein Spo0J